MNVVHAVLCEDYGRLDAGAIRNELMAEAGIHEVSFEKTGHRLRIEYDPRLVSHTRLVDMMCRHALFPEPPGGEETG
ncbi:MAG TPA: hypothetical protein VHH11_02710 [Gammaproteobacteria bacterium]|jgi:hypothetical protein|nr:hypothetical protein [Gammaproteobacteria bacterium]